MASNDVKEIDEENLNDEESVNSFSGESDGSSSGYEAEWAEHISNDGSVFYVESYISSTLKEKQEQALKAQPDKKNAFNSNDKQFKKQNKLLGLLKRRPSIRSKKSSNVGLTEESAQKNVSESLPLKVTFRDNPSGEVRQVELQVTEHHTGLGRRASLCEIVLGVVPGRFSEPPDSRVMVAGLVPGSEALRSGGIKIGDWLKEVNERALTWDNFNTVLQTIHLPSTITVIVQKCASETLPHNDSEISKHMVQTSLVKLITNAEQKQKNTNENKMKLRELPHTVLYLSLRGVTEDDPDGADIKYQFPSWSNKLVFVRGMLITIAHTVQEAIGQPALRSSVLIDEEYYHIAYSREENDVFLIALPHSCVTQYEIVGYMEKLSRLLKFEFGTISNAFTNPMNKNYINHLMSLMLGNILSTTRLIKPTRSVMPKENTSNNLYIPQLGETTFISNASSVLLAPPLLLLTDSAAKLQIDNCLSELESGDFGDDEFDCGDCEMLYSIIGTCLFYKNYLLASHLTNDDLINLWLFSSMHGLLNLVSQEALSQLVSWRRVYVTTAPIISTDNLVKHYILFVAMNHMLLGMLVESGNVTELLEDMSGPDPVLVDQIETTLYHLHGLHIHSFCEEILVQGGIETYSVDENFKSNYSKKLPKQVSIESHEGVRAPDVPSILKQRSSGAGELYVKAAEDVDDTTGQAGNVSDDTHSSMESPSSHQENSYNEDDESLDSDWQIWKNKEQQPFDAENNVFLPKSPIFPFRLTVGKKKVLLHFIQLDIGEGYLIESIPPSSEESLSPLYHQVAENFKITCAHISHILHAPDEKEPSGVYTNNNIFSGIREHGVMFSLKPSQLHSGSKSSSQTVFYWVVGRLITGTHQNEVYVCYDDAIPQNIQELAFKLSMTNI